MVQTEWYQISRTPIDPFCQILWTQSQLSDSEIESFWAVVDLAMCSAFTLELVEQTLESRGLRVKVAKVRDWQGEEIEHSP